MQRVHEGGELPASKVSGEEQHPLAASGSAFVVFEAVVDHHAAYVLQGVAGKLADFGQLSAEGSKFAAQDSGVFVTLFFWQSHGQVAHADMPQTYMQQVDQPGQ